MLTGSSGKLCSIPGCLTTEPRSGQRDLSALVFPASFSSRHSIARQILVLFATGSPTELHLVPNAYEVMVVEQSDSAELLGLSFKDFVISKSIRRHRFLGIPPPATPSDGFCQGNVPSSRSLMMSLVTSSRKSRGDGS